MIIILYLIAFHTLVREHQEQILFGKYCIFVIILIGCGCEYSAFGCCPDNETVARGPDNAGCGCQYTEYGCCPDNHTPAAGEDFNGCPCNTYTYGCCPDGVSIARGPGTEGKSFLCRWCHLIVNRLLLSQ